jgi:hypothetical protein
MLEIIMVPVGGLAYTIENVAMVDRHYPMKPSKRVPKWPEIATKERLPVIALPGHVGNQRIPRRY